VHDEHVVVHNFNHLKRAKPEVVKFTMLGIVIPSGIPPQNQVTFLKNLLLGFLIKGQFDLALVCLCSLIKCIPSLLNFYNTEYPPLDVFGLLNILLQEFQDWYTELSRKNNVYAINNMEW
jgi:hypothetical protein